MSRGRALSFLMIAVLPSLALGAKEDLYAITGPRIVTVSGPTLITR